jgi:predicted glycoside hydrolase/deacetylase ChbG (UPF0249 family)
MFTTMLQLAKEYNVPVRFPPEIEYINKYDPASLLSAHNIKHADRLINSFHLNHTTNEKMTYILRNLEPGISELMCHPGYFSSEITNTGDTYKFREQELSILTNPEIVREIEENNILLSTYSF